MRCAIRKRFKRHLTAAETGHLGVCNAAYEFRDGIGKQNHRRVSAASAGAGSCAQLSMSLEAVMTQKLIPRKSGTGVIMAAEVMMCTPAIRALIRENKVHEMYGILQVSQKYGMQTLESIALRSGDQ